MVIYNGKKFHDIEQWQLDFIIENWLRMKNRDIGASIEVSAKRVSRIGSEVGLPSKSDNRQSYDGVVIGGRIYGNVTKEQVDYMLSNADLPVAEIGRRLGIDPRRVSDIQIASGVRESKCSSKWIPCKQAEQDLLNTKLTNKQLAKKYKVSTTTISSNRRRLGVTFDTSTRLKLPMTLEVEADLKDPYKSHVFLANKYGVSEACIARRRDSLGVTVRRCNFNTMPEIKFASVLDELDIVYVQQKRIGKWSIDFYLGSKICIDVHGEWVHSKSIVAERDIRKSAYLRDNGYKYLTIPEDELDNLELVKDKVINFLGRGTLYGNVV